MKLFSRPPINQLKNVLFLTLIWSSVSFAQSKKPTKTSNPTNQKNSPDITLIKISEASDYDPAQSYATVDVVPQYPGGPSMMKSFILSNLKYPKSAQKENIQGTVISEFRVGTDGKIDRIKIRRSIGYGTDEEVIRILNKMPAWIPAQSNGKPVAALHTLPFTFRLDD